MRKMKKIMYLSLAVLLVFTLAGCVKDKPAKETFTYNYASSVFPTNWNPHTYETANDADILGYTESGFYTFDYNETKDGYKVVPAMAKSEPLDVTAEYVGEEWGIEEGATGRVYKIDLKDNLKWEDGTPINATSFVESAKRLLDPAADNYRADSLYEGNLVIANAKTYYYQGETNLYTATTCYEEYPLDGSLDADLVFTLSEPKEEFNNQEVYMRKSMGFPKSYDAAKCAAYLIGNYLKGSAFTAEAAAAMEGKTLAEIKADETLKAAWEALIGWWQTDPNEELHFFLANYTWPEVKWENVGIFEEDGDLVLVLEKSLKGFYLLYNLTGSWLVHEETYDKCASITDGIYNNTYGTSVETFKSYGPYKLTYFELDKEYRFEKNENWYGYAEAENKGLYQTTDIVCKFIEEPATRLQEFEKGNLDSYGLQASDMGKYINSSELYYTEGASTFFIALNPSLEGLKAAQEQAGENKNKTIMTILEFRQALSFAVNRVEFCLACDPTGKPSKSVFNNLIISDPENGTAFRTNEEAKDVVLAFWGLTDEVGEGKRYATKDEAIAAITGVDLAQAKEKFTVAYEKAIEQGLMDEDDVVELKIGIPSASAEFYINGNEFLKNCWTDAVKGTPLEGKLTFTKDDTIGNGFADALKNNQVDVLFGVGWTGSALDPYSLVSAYTDPSYQYDPGINYTAVDAEVYFDSIVDADGKEWKNITLVASVDEWSNKALAGETIECSVKGSEGETVKVNAGTECPLDTRTKILCAIEGKVLEQYTMLPLDDESSAALKGKQVEYYTEEYVYGVGRGGIKYMKYNYNDKEWAKYVAELGGIIDYAAAEEE